jgi:hypothetical protein
VTWIVERWQHSTATSWECMKVRVIQLCNLWWGHFSHTRSVVNHDNCNILDSENPHALMEHVCGSPKVNIWCGITLDQILPREHHHECSSPGYARQFWVPTDSNWSWWPQFPTRWCTSLFWCHCSHCFGWTISWLMDRQGRAD